MIETQTTWMTRVHRVLFQYQHIPVVPMATLCILHLHHHLQAPFHRRCQMLFLRLHRQVMVTFLHPMVFLLVPTMDLHTRVCLHILVYLLHRPNLFLVRHLLQSNHQSTTMMG